MRRPTISSLGLAAAAICCAGLLGGCGSSGGASTSSATTTATQASVPQTGTAAGGSSLKVATTPKYAQPLSSETARSGTVQIAYHNITISPDTLRVKAGTTVVWTNHDPVQHDVTSESGPQRFASQRFGEGQSFAVKLTHPGTVHYECTIHPTTMNGTIEVLR